MDYDFEGIYMGIVYDSLRIIGLRHEDFYINLKPKCGYSKIIHGPAFTTFGEKTDANISVEEYQTMDNLRLDIYKKHLFKDKPIVFLQSNDDIVAHSGDLTSLIYKKLGAVGFITDGNVRDIDIIEELQFPVFCKDENPIDAWMYWALTKFQIDIEIDGVNISPGDYTFASRDGVIVVPNEFFDEFKKVSSEQLDRENTIRNMIHNNKSTPDYKKLVEELGRW